MRMRHERRRSTARSALFCAAAALLTLLILQGATFLNQGEQTPEESPTERKSVLKPKKKLAAPQTLENSKLVPDEYKWRDPHPWLFPVRGERYRRYMGPQTAEAIFAVYDSPYTTGEETEKLLAHWKLVLARGAVVNDYKDALEYGFRLMKTLERIRSGSADLGFYRRFHNLPASASVGEIAEAEMARKIRLWPIKKEQYSHAVKTGEGTLNVTLFPDSYGGGGMGMSIVRTGRGRKSSDLTDKERYNISRYGIAPKGFRLRFEDADSNEIPFDLVPFFNERDAAKRLNKANLEQLLFAIPSYLSQPEAHEQSTVEWMLMVDRYDAALAELADRGQVPEAAAPLAYPPQPAAPPNPPLLPNAEQRRRVAEAYVSALEKQAAKATIGSIARSQISRRIQELRALVFVPAGLPVEPPPAQDNSGGSKEE